MSAPAHFQVTVTQVVEVSLDLTKFDEAFMREFRESFFGFETIEEHAEHIAQLHARGVVDASYAGEFIEGYGPARDMGITARTVSLEHEVHHERA